MLSLLSCIHIQNVVSGEKCKQAFSKTFSNKFIFFVVHSNVNWNLTGIFLIELCTEMQKLSHEWHLICSSLFFLILWNSGRKKSKKNLYLHRLLGHQIRLQLRRQCKFRLSYLSLYQNLMLLLMYLSVGSVLLMVPDCCLHLVRLLLASISATTKKKLNWKNTLYIQLKGSAQHATKTLVYNMASNAQTI